MGGRGARLREGKRTPSGKTWQDFQRMTTEEVGDFYDHEMVDEIPEELSDTMLQSFVYNLGMNSGPEIVSEEEFKKLLEGGAEAIYRGVDDDIYNDELLDGKLTWMGEGVYGDGLYFAAAKGVAKGYGDYVTGAILNKNAKVIDSDKLNALQRAEAKKSAEKEKQLQQAKNWEALEKQQNGQYYLDVDRSVFALKHGYNVIHIQHPNYYVVLDRSALTMSRKRYGWGD